MSRDAGSTATPGATEADDLMRVCPHGHANPAGWTICGECGARLAATSRSMKRRA